MYAAGADNAQQPQVDFSLALAFLLLLSCLAKQHLSIPYSFCLTKAMTTTAMETTATPEGESILRGKRYPFVAFVPTSTNIPLFLSFTVM